jgi:hypothetical protein
MEGKPDVGIDILKIIREIRAAFRNVANTSITECPRLPVVTCVFST